MKRSAWSLFSCLTAGFFLGDASGAGRPAIDFAERVRAQTAIERVSYGHQIGTTRPFEEAVPRRVIERKVRTYLKQSIALERFWRTPVTAQALDRELARIATNTRMPGRLKEIYRALGNDPTLVRECFVRPILVDRLARNFHGRSSGSADSWDVWWSGVEGSLDPATLQTPAARTAPLPQPLDRPDPASPQGCDADGAWDEASLGTPPNGRDGHTAVWTGNVMVVWGGQYDNSGGQYDPLTDTWTPTSKVNAPLLPFGHVAFWTGSEMLAWGGSDTPIGGRYDPSTDTWTPMSTVGAPSARDLPSGVWTGTRMIVWGGFDDADGTRLDTGGLYDPVTDTWSPVSTTDAPSPRGVGATIWTGTKMIVWGGFGELSSLDSGALYDPATDSWSPMSGVDAPPAMDNLAAVWTGSRMVIWGGYSGGGVVGTGGQYDPATDTWSGVSEVGAPSPRTAHVALWTGDKVLIWGGSDGTNTVFDDGAYYDPDADSWTTIPASGTMAGRYGASAVLNGQQVIVWGGWNGVAYTATGGRFDLASGTWTPTTTLNMPSQRNAHSAVWTGSRMIVWGGHGGNIDYNDGGLYDPVTDSWTPTSMLNAPTPRQTHTAVWAGDRMIVWGGVTDFSTPGYPVVGGRYDPVADAWSPTSASGAPSPRNMHTAVWTGSRMIVWGGGTGGGGVRATDAGRYDPVLDTWSPVSQANAPTPRVFHSAIWTGHDMVIWGGYSNQPEATGGRYDPALNQWFPTSTTNAPAARWRHAAVWTGTRMIVWGGDNNLANTFPITGGSYNPETNFWTVLSTSDVPLGRTETAAVWAGDRMLVWGGYDGTSVGTGGQYFPSGDAWAPITTSGTPPRRQLHTAVWTGESMVVWGGYGERIYGTGSHFIPGAPLADSDSDGVSNCYDNCGVIPNASQVDSDLDGVGDPCDCDPGDARVTGPPDSSILTMAGDAVTLLWSNSGASTVRKLVRGLISELPVGAGASEICLGSGLTGPSATDAEMPSLGEGFWYLSRESNGCGVGTYGHASDGTPHAPSACP